jgi:hypothetical protein
MNLFKRYGEAKTELRRVQLNTLRYRIFEAALDRATRRVSVQELRAFYTFMHDQPERRHFVIPGVGFAYEVKR